MFWVRGGEFACCGDFCLGGCFGIDRANSSVLNQMASVLDRALQTRKNRVLSLLSRLVYPSGKFCWRLSWRNN